MQQLHRKTNHSNYLDRLDEEVFFHFSFLTSVKRFVNRGPNLEFVCDIKNESFVGKILKEGTGQTQFFFQIKIFITV